MTVNVITERNFVLLLMQPPISAEERGGEKDAEGLYRKEQVFILYLIQFIARV